MSERVRPVGLSGRWRVAGRAARAALAALAALPLAVGGGRWAAAQDEAATPGAGGAARTAALAPESAVMFFVADLDLGSPQWTQTRELLGRAGFPNAIEDLEREVLGEFDIEATDDPVDLAPFYGGEVGVVVMAEAVDDEYYSGSYGTPTPAGEVPASGNAAILLPGDPDAAWVEVESQFDERADRAAVPEEQIERGGVTIRALGDPGDYSSTAQAIARVDDFILLAETAADLEPILDVAAGEAASLADFAPMAELRADVAPETVLFAFLNGERYEDALGPGYREYLDAIFPDGPGGALFDHYGGLAVSADEPGFRFDVVARPKAGADVLELPDNRELAGAERASADALVFAAGADLSETGVLDLVALAIAEGVVEDDRPAAAALAEGTPESYVPYDERETAAYVEGRFAGAEEILGFDLKADLFDRFVGDYFFSVEVSDFFALGAGVSAAFASDAEGSETVAGALRTLARYEEANQRLDDASGSDVDVSARRVGDDTVYVVRETESGLTPTFEFGVVEEQIVAGAGAGLERYLAGIEEPLADDEQYQRVLATLPAEHSQVFYVDLTQIVPLFGLSAQASVTESVDADPACADYGSAEAAQAAYEEDPFGNGVLDQDFDDVACEDYFGADGATPAASPNEIGSPDAIEALASVVYEGEGVIGSSTILYIAEP